MKPSITGKIKSEERSGMGHHLQGVTHERVVAHDKDPSIITFEVPMTPYLTLLENCNIMPL